MGQNATLTNFCANWASVNIHAFCLVIWVLTHPRLDWTINDVQFYVLPLRLSAKSFVENAGICVVVSSLFVIGKHTPLVNIPNPVEFHAFPVQKWSTNSWWIVHDSLILDVSFLLAIYIYIAICCYTWLCPNSPHIDIYVYRYKFLWKFCTLKIHGLLSSLSLVDGGNKTGYTLFPDTAILYIIWYTVIYIYVWILIWLCLSFDSKWYIQLCHCCSIEGGTSFQ